MVEFQIAYDAYLKANGIEKPIQYTEHDFDNQYKVAAEKLKKLGKMGL